MGSFKLKLVVYFLLLSVLPMAAAFWGFTAVAGQSETRKVDARLQAGLRAVLASYQERVDGAQREATALARVPVFQRELEVRDLPGIVHVLRNAASSNVSRDRRRRLPRQPAAELRGDRAGRRRHAPRSGRLRHRRGAVRRTLVELCARDPGSRPPTRS